MSIARVRELRNQIANEAAEELQRSRKNMKVCIDWELKIENWRLVVHQKEFHMSEDTPPDIMRLGLWVDGSFKVCSFTVKIR